MRWTDADLAALSTRGDTRVLGEHPRAVIVPILQPVRHQDTEDQYRSKTERRFAMMILGPALASGEITHWWYEGLKLRLAATCFYTPDFLIQYPDGALVVLEVKGFWREDARIKIKVAAAHYPCFQFRAARYVKGAWQYEDF